MEKPRCSWCLKDDLYKKYHDEVWGDPEKDPKRLWIKLILEGQQAGLSWYTILVKEQGYQAAYSNWDIKEIANFPDSKIEELILDKRIIRNRLKIKSIIKNAKAYLTMKKEGLNFSEFIWSFTDHKTLINQIIEEDDLISQSDESRAMSKSLKKMGFSFVGPTICYAYMQAIGMIDDHEEKCWKKHKE